MKDDGPRWSREGLARLCRAYYADWRVGRVIEPRRDIRAGGSSRKQPFDLTSRSSLTTRSYSSRGLLIRYM